MSDNHNGRSDVVGRITHPIDLNEVFNEVGIALAVIDSKRGILWRNRRFHFWFVGKGSKKVNGILGPDQILRAIRSKRVRYFEREISDGGGKKRHFKFSLVPLRRNGPDRKFRLLVIAYHATEKSKMKLKAEKLSRLNESIVKNAPVGIFTLDREGNVTSTNPAHIRMGDTSQKKIMAMNWIKAETAIRAGISDKVKEGLAGKAFELNSIPYTAHTTGKPLFISVKGVPIKNENGEVDGLLCIVEDTTERKKIEERYQTLFESASDGIFVTDTKGSLITVNPKMVQLLGESRHKLIGKNILAFIKESQIAKMEEMLAQVSIGNHLEPCEIDLVTRERNIVSVEMNLSKVKQVGETNLAQGIARDVTERKQMEAQLMRESKLSTIGRLAFGLAHEINNPLGLISWYVEDLLEKLEVSSPTKNMDVERVKRSLEVMKEQASRGLNVIGNILDFARSTVTKYEKVDLIRAIKRALDLVESEAQWAQKKISKKLDFPPVYILGNESEMIQVFLNILNNALDATGAAGKIAVCTKSSGEEVAISISDDGTGIAHENLDKIFDPFFSTKPKGTGLGLSICYGIVQRMNGRIEVQSRAGKGTTFTIFIPKYPN